MDVGANFLITANVAGQPQIDKLNESMKNATVQIGGVDKSAKQLRQNMSQLAPQFTDIATQLAGGQSPFLVLLQQGGQIKDIFGGFRPAGAALLSLITPARAVAAALAVIGYAAYSGYKQMQELNNSIRLTGNYAGQTYGSVDALRRSLEKTSDVSAGVARGLTAAAVSSGAFGPAVLQPALSAMAAVQKLTDQTETEVVKDFASMRNGVASWAAEHNKQYNYLSAAQYKHIRQLEDQGKVEEAMKVNMDALNDAFKKRAEQLGWLGQAWDTLGKKASAAWDFMLGIGKPDTIDDKIKSLEDRLKSMQDMRAFNGKLFGGIFGESGKSEPEKAVETALARAREEKMRSEAAARDQAARASEEQKGIEREKAMADQRLAIQSTTLDALKLKSTTALNDRLNGLKVEEAEVDRLRGLDLISEQQAADRKAAIRKRENEARIADLRTQIAVEQSREFKFNDFAGPKSRDMTVSQLQSQIRDLSGQAKVIDAQTRATIDGLNKSAADSFAQFAAGVQKQIAGLVADNSVEAAKLITDPIKREREQLDAEVNKIKDKYNELVIPIKLKLEKEGANLTTDQKAKLNEAITAIEAERDKAVSIKMQGTTLPDDWFGGIKNGLKSIANETQNTAKLMEGLLVGAFNKSADALTDFVMTGKLNFSDFARSVIRDIISMITRQMMFNALASGANAIGFGSLFGGASSAGTASAGTASVSNFAANGMAFNAGTQAFAKGGIVDSPTRFRFAAGGAIQNGLMGEAGAEAIMPLKRGKDGKLGVAASGGSAGGVTIGSIVVQSNGNAQANDTSGQNGAQLGRVIATAVQSEIIKQKRPGGLLAA